MERESPSESDRNGLRSFTFRDEVPDGSSETEEADRKRQASRARKALIISLGLLLILGGGVVLGAYALSERSLNQVERIPAFEGLDEEARPDKPSTGAGSNSINILLTGIDTRESRKSTGAGAGDEWKRTGQRSDTIIILHIPDDRKSANLISIPRDSWVDIPGHGLNKINAAYSFGGPTLYIETVEQLTGLRIDHLAVIGWEGFRDLTDALGGVTMTFDEPVEGASRQVFPAGEVTLNGEEALDYVRARYNLPNGDFDRVRRQQNFLRSLMKQTLSKGTVTNPVKLNNVLDAVTQNLSVDEQFTNNKMRKLALEMRDIRSDDVTFMTAPVSGTGMEGDQSVVYLDSKKLEELFGAVKVDNLDAYLEKYGTDETLGDDVN